MPLVKTELILAIFTESFKLYNLNTDRIPTEINIKLMYNNYSIKKNVSCLRDKTANKIGLRIVVSMLDHRLRRQPHIKTTLLSFVVH